MEKGEGRGEERVTGKKRRGEKKGKKRREEKKGVERYRE